MEATTIDMAAVLAAVQKHRARAQRAVAATVCVAALGAVLQGALLPAPRGVAVAGPADPTRLPAPETRPVAPHGS
jgi:hypothetical protein